MLAKKSDKDILKSKINPLYRSNFYVNAKFYSRQRIQIILARVTSKNFNNARYDLALSPSRYDVHILLLFGDKVDAISTFISNVVFLKFFSYNTVTCCSLVGMGMIVSNTPF